VTMAETRKRLIDDAGEKIEGARKDWKARAMSVSDLAAMTDEEIIIEARKDNIWPKPDYGELVRNGMSREAAAYVKLIRDRMAQEPRALKRVDPVTLRRHFVEMTSMLRDLLSKCVTVADVRNVGEEIQRKMDSRGEDGLKKFSVCRGNKYPFVIQYDDGIRAAKMLEEGFPDPVPAWRRGLSLSFRRDGTLWLIKGHKVLRDGFRSEDEAWTWAKENLKSDRKPSPDKKTEPKRPHLDSITRTGMPFSLEGKNISPEDFISTFGFRGVQFGNWLPDNERQQVLNLGYEALMDLAHILGWEPEWMSLGGTLAIAFGARGKGGKFSAHYEPGQRVVNMTRMSGAGAFAHEFAHALDHWTGTGTEAMVPGGIPSGSGWCNLVTSRSALLSHRGMDAAVAWDRLMDSILYSPTSREERLKQLENKVADVDSKLAVNRTFIERQQAMPAERRRPKHLRQALEWENHANSVREALLRKIEETRIAPEDGDFGKGYSNFVNEALALSGSGDYWKRPTELFARAFESWVYDRIAEEGGVSQYLVSGVEEGLFSDPAFKGDPYPSGKERERINEAMAEMVRTMTPCAELDAKKTVTPAL